MLHFLLTFHMTTGNRNNGREGKGGGGVRRCRDNRRYCNGGGGG